VWAFDNSTGELVKIDTAPRSRDVLRFPLGGRVVAMAAGGEDVWLADEEAGQVVRVDATSGSATLRVDFANPTALLLDGDALWVAYGAGSIAELEAGTGSLLRQAEIGRPAIRMSRVGDRLIVVGQDGASFSADVSDLGVSTPGPSVISVATSDRRIWATVASGYLVELDPRSMRPVASLQLEVDVRGGLVFGAGALWCVGTDAAGDPVIVKVEPRS
jgi:hypothetical protein